MTEKDEIININLDENARDYRNSMRSITSSFSSVAEIISKDYEPFSESIKNITTSLENFYNCESFKKLTRITEEVSKTILPIYETTISNLQKTLKQIEINIPKIEFPERIIKNIRKIHVLGILNEYEWPLFMDIDDNFSDTINDCKIDYKDREFINFLEKEIYKRYNDSYIEQLDKKWTNDLYIKKERKEILKEALLQYKECKYISCVSILACQLCGIIDDIGIKDKKQLDNEFKKELNDTLYYMYGNKNKHINDLKSEKNRFLYVICSLEGGPIYLDTIMKYIYMVVFGSEDKLRNGNSPSRNKICHGEQLNINSRNQALKSILVTDILINLLDIFKNNEGEVSENVRA